MTVKDAMDLLGADVLVGEEHLDREVRSACGSIASLTVITHGMCGG